MKRRELERMQRHSFLALKALFVASLDPEFLEKIHPTAIATASALHQACCRELFEGMVNVSANTVLQTLSDIDLELAEGRDPAYTPNLDQRVTNARKLARDLFNAMMEAFEDDEDDEEEIV